ncbi:MAG: ATP-binding protein [Pyrinomonadaceae bacterium]|nr:ATP-binding protein [Pyrinomonadaceae bacterium]
MTDSIVNHPLFGRGRVLEIRNAAREAVVRFDNGIRAVVQTNILTILENSQPIAPAPVVPIQREETIRTAEDLKRIEARQTIEALRYGVVPARRIRELSVGLEDERASLHEAFENVAQTGGDVRFVLGEYGAGKSHFFELAAQEALENNFIVATTSLDLREVPPNRPQRIYNSLMRSLRYPNDADSRTVVPLLDKIVASPKLYAELVENLQGTIFGSALYNYSLMRERDDEALMLLLDWISGEKVAIQKVRQAVAFKSKEVPIPNLAQITTAADQYCYLLNGWGWLAQQAGYAGLAVFIDESEHYSLLNQRGQERADNFFKGLIYTALASRPDCRVHENLLEHQHRPHPFRLTERSQLLLLFAVTPSASTFDYRRWLDDEQIISLKRSLPAEALDELMARLYVLHRQAYEYENTNHYLDVSAGLIECLENNLLNLRQTIRLAVDIYDRCYAHPDYTAAQAVGELRQALLGRE